MWLIRKGPGISLSSDLKGFLLRLPPPCVPYTGLPHYLRWCVLSTPEIQKCGDMAVAFSRQRLKPEIQCVSAESPEHCMEHIQVEWAGEEAVRSLAWSWSPIPVGWKEAFGLRKSLSLLSMAGVGDRPLLDVC